MSPYRTSVERHSALCTFAKQEFVGTSWSRNWALLAMDDVHVEPDFGNRFRFECKVPDCLVCEGQSW